MYRKLISLSLAMVCVLSLACKKDAEVVAVVEEVDLFTKELVKRVESNPTAAGVDDAQQYLDSKKAEITARLATIKDIRDSQISEDTRKKRMETITNDSMSVARLQFKTITNPDPEFKTKIEKLNRDYQSLIESAGSSGS